LVRDIENHRSDANSPCREAGTGTARNPECDELSHWFLYLYERDRVGLT